MNVTHDLIAAVTGPGWKYGLSRILLNDEGQGVVFIAGSEEPFAYFTIQNSSTSRGAGFNDEGEIKWRRRGSSCQYKLAKCKVSTEQMTQRWLDALDEPVTEEPEAVAVPDGSAAVVMDWVGDDPEKAQLALDAEADGQQRKGLTADLEKIVAAGDLL